MTAVSNTFRLDSTRRFGQSNATKRSQYVTVVSRTLLRRGDRGRSDCVPGQGPADHAGPAAGRLPRCRCRISDAIHFYGDRARPDGATRVAPAWRARTGERTG